MKRLLNASLFALVALVSISGMAFAHPDHPHPTKEPTEKPALVN